MAETIYRNLTQEEIAHEEMETRLRTEFARNTELYCAREEGLAEGLAEGKIEGKAEGLAEGAAMGQSRFAALTAKLLDAGRIDDLRKATENAAYRDTLFIELGIE